MLISKSGYSAGDIVAFKLVNGDECVAKIVDTNLDEFVVNKPYTIIPSPKGVGMVPSLFTGKLENNVILHRSHVLMHSEAVKEIVDYYTKTTIGIVTAPAGLVV